MAMSQGTSTFLACFGGFWLVWALVVLFCCLCSFLQRRLKRLREERHREQCLRTVETESLTCPAPCHAPSHVIPAITPSRETPHISSTQLCTVQTTPGTAPPPHLPHLLPQANWVTMPTDADVFGKPPCYEKAILMEDPPPPYSEVLADPRGGTYLKPGVIRPAPCPVPSPYPVPAPCPAPTHCPVPSPCSITSPYPVPAPCPVSAPCPITSPYPVPAPCPVPAHCPVPSSCSIPSPYPAPSPCPAPTACPITAPLPVPNYPVYSESKPPPVLADRGYSSLIRLPSSQRWDSLGHLLSNMDLNHNQLTPPAAPHSLRATGAMAATTMPRRDTRMARELRVQSGYSSLQSRTNLGGHRRLHRVRGLEPNCSLPTAFPLLGRSTAV